jgi:glycosyltransferase involved in cell wall biosynthesis
VADFISESVFDFIGISKILRHGKADVLLHAHSARRKRVALRLVFAALSWEISVDEVGGCGYPWSMISVVVPTYQERENIERLVERSAAALSVSGEEFELIIVDDNSPDGTAQEVQRLQADRPWLKLIVRKNGRDLSTAVLAGWRAAQGEILGCMDGDLQHPPEELTRLAECLRGTDAELVIASRNTKDGGVSEWKFRRRIISWMATRMAQFVLPGKAGPVHDPMSGFFLMKRSVVEGVELKPRGYKILLEVLVRGVYGRVKEVPYRFMERAHGGSKIGPRQVWLYLRHLALLLGSRPAPPVSDSQDLSAGLGHILVYCALLAAHVALIWLLPFFPTQDGPNHLYNLVILHDMLHGRGGWEQYYALNLHLTPNLGFTLFTYPLLAVMSPMVAQRVFLTIYVLLFGASVPAFLRALGKPAFPLSYFAFVAIFSQSVSTGFYSEVIGTPLLLLAVALAWKMRDSRLSARFLALNLAGLALFLVHLIPFAIYLLAVEIQAVTGASRWRERLRHGLARLVILTPCLACAGLFYFQHRTPAVLEWSVRPGYMLRDLFSFGEYSYSLWQLLPAYAALLLVFFAARTGHHEQPAFPGSEDDRARRFLMAFCLILVAIFLAAPDSLMGGAELQRRLPPLILLFGLPLLKPWTPRLTPRRYAQLAIAMAAFTLAINGGIFWKQSRGVAQFVRGVQAGLPRGATLLSARVDAGKHASPDALRHASSYYGLAGAVDLGQFLNFESSDPYFQVHFRDPISWGTAWAVYEKPQLASGLAQVQFLLCWGGTKTCRESLVPDFTLYWSESGNPLSVWKRQVTACCSPLKQKVVLDRQGLP